MNHCVVVTVWGSALVLCAGLAQAGPRSGHDGNGHDTSAGALPECPVTGERVNLAVHVRTVDGPVFFCCKGCVKKYEADRGRFAAKVAAQREALADRPKVQVVCPVSGEPADRNVFADHDGQKVYFCCAGCAKKFQRDPAKYKTALANGATYQTMCPVTGEGIDPEAFTKTVGGHSVYFCCKACDKKLFRDPDQYLPNLEAQGFAVKPNEMKHGE